jgi:hypothetical protein
MAFPKYGCQIAAQVFPCYLTYSKALILFVQFVCVTLAVAVSHKFLLLIYQYPEQVPIFKFYYSSKLADCLYSCLRYPS